MDFSQALSDFGDLIVPYLTKEYLLSVWGITKIVLIVILVLILIRIFIRLKFFRRIKLLLKNAKEINQKMDKIIELLSPENNLKEDSVIKKFIKKK